MYLLGVEYLTAVCQKKVQPVFTPNELVFAVVLLLLRMTPRAGKQLVACLCVMQDDDTTTVPIAVHVMA